MPEYPFYRYRIYIFLLTVAVVKLPALGSERRAVSFPELFPYRTVEDNERGSIFTTPARHAWNELGAYVGVHNSLAWSQLSTGAIKVIHGRFHLIKPSDDYTWAWFPYTKFLQFEQQQIAKGGRPLRVTATVNGSKRPILWRWSLGLSQAMVATAPPQSWEQAVNVGDPRYIRFWVDEYVRPILLEHTGSLNNVWIGLDECAFNFDLYGIVDNERKFTPGIPWDSPFPGNDEEFLNSVRFFFSEIRSYAPDINVMCNIGSLKDWRRFPEVFRDVPAIMQEEVLEYDGSSYARLNRLLPLFTALNWFGEQRRVAILRTSVPDDPIRIRTSFAAYMLVRGPNFFFAPRIAGTVDEVPPDRYAAYAAALGKPISAMDSAVEPGAPNEGYRLYWRECEGGRVYLNWSGREKRVVLPEDRVYLNTKGVPVKELVLPDMTGDYVLFDHSDRCATPRIRPRLRGTVAAPVSIEVAAEGADIVRYTLDGSMPDIASTPYTGPVVIKESTTVRARAFCAGETAPSHVSSARFRVRESIPRVGFYGPKVREAVSEQEYFLVRLSHAASRDTIIRYAISSFPPHASDGIRELLIPAGERSRHIGISVRHLLAATSHRSVSIEIFSGDHYRLREANAAVLLLARSDH